MPVRIQQRRTRGWRKPENTVSVARPSKWGNPHHVGEDSGFYGIPHDRWSAAFFYRHDLEFGDGIWWESGYRCLTIADVRAELAGKNLMCFCPLDQPCHADVLLELANPAPLCPECRDGKCRNCVGEALTDDDELVPCGCPNHERKAA